MEAKGAEVRRIHIVYFLCRMGKTEHPHLIRLYHQNRNGVRLRDVKRWLAEVRGKDMPDSFSWSYRRKYKTGYVWQDLLDDDLITPISDNEYVLKGSEISSSYPDTSFSSENSPPSKKTSFNSSNENIRVDLPEKLAPENNAANAIPATTGSSLLTFEVLTDEKSTETDSTVLTKSSTETREEIEDSPQSSSPSSVSLLDETQEHENHSTTREQAPTLRRSRLRDLLTCRTTDASDPVVSTMRQQKGEVNKMERLRPEPGTILSQSWNQNQPCSRKRCNSAKSLKKENDPVYKSVAKPNCSQCGKRFQPEKLHAHMQSCPGMKNRAKRSEATKTTQTETGDASITTGIAQL